MCIALHAAWPEMTTWTIKTKYLFPFLSLSSFLQQNGGGGVAFTRIPCEWDVTYPRRQNVTTSMVGLKNSHVRKKSHQKMVNPRDIAGNAEETEDVTRYWMLTRWSAIPLQNKTLTKPESNKIENVCFRKWRSVWTQNHTKWSSSK